jgi:hypothetical protein
MPHFYPESGPPSDAPPPPMRGAFSAPPGRAASRPRNTRRRAR